MYFTTFLIFALQGFSCVFTLTPSLVDSQGAPYTLASDPSAPDTCCAFYGGSWSNMTDPVTSLRQQMLIENISAYIILSTDEHQSETTSFHDKRIKFISNFSGSNGIAVVTLSAAALWTDSRYYSQALKELDRNWILMREGLGSTPKIQEWLATMLKSGDAVSSDPKIASYEKWITWKNNFEKFNVTMKVIQDNLIDRIWKEGRPPLPVKPLFCLDLMFVGETWQNKIGMIRHKMRKSNVDTFVMTALDEIAWTLNLRGDDIPYYPVFRAYMIIKLSESFLYVSPDKITVELTHHLNSNGSLQGESVKLRWYDQIWTDITSMSQTSTKVGLPSRYSYFNGVNYLLYLLVPKEKAVLMISPALLFKDSKNDVECSGMRASHIRDAVALCQFLANLEDEVTNGYGKWTEMRAVRVLDDLRRKQKYNVGISFGTVVAFGKNAANPHYQPTTETDTEITTSQLLMIDSGGHYLDGTTDVTRTVHYGNPKEIEKEIYTRLLIGSINVASVIFKEGYDVKQLEILLREPLYEIGLDYGHGSTHGIGHFLGVHEAFNTTYHLGFFGSQEPGYYEDSNFGMRLENIVTVVKPEYVPVSNYTFFTFETITLVPYEKKLIKQDLLSPKHISWINNYHDRVRKIVGEEMLRQGMSKEYQWLLQKTEPLN